MSNRRYIRKGHRFFNNRARLSSPGYNGMCNSGRALRLARDSYIDVPINATVFDDASRQTRFGKVGDITVDADGGIVTMTYTGDDDDVFGYAYQRLSAKSPNFLTRNPNNGDSYKFKIRVKASKPDIAEFELYGFKGASVFGFAKAGIETTDWCDVYIDGKSRGVNTDYISFRFTDGASNGDTITVDISQCEAKRIPEVNGQVSYFSILSKKYDALELELEETCRLEYNTYGPVIRLWDTVFTDEDFDILYNNPEMLIKWANGDDIGLSVGTIKPNDAVYYPSEDGLILISAENERCQERIEVSGDYTFIDDYPYSIQDSKIYLDDDGIPTATIDEPKMNKLGNVELAWEPKLPTYTIIETVEGDIPDRSITGEELDDSYKVEERWLAYNVNTGFEYFVNGKQQAYGAGLQENAPVSGPSLGGLPVMTVMNSGYTLRGTATIGPKDDIEFRSGFKVYSTYKVPDTATCADSVGGANGTEYNFDKVWTTRCKIFNAEEEV